LDEIISQHFFIFISVKQNVFNLNFEKHKIYPIIKATCGLYSLFLFLFSNLNHKLRGLAYQIEHVLTTLYNMAWKKNYI